MARIRTIKPEFWTDEKIISLPFHARLFFIGLWNFADDHGFLKDEPSQLKLLIMPCEESIDVFQTLDLLLSADLIERYMDTESGNTFLLIKNWTLHQRVDKPSKSRIYKEGAKKVTIPNSLRRKIAEKYNCKPGKSKSNECYFCGEKGNIQWFNKSNGTPSGWVSFSHEMAHIIPEVDNGPTNETNLVLACRSCNRSMGPRHAFDWLFNGSYTSNCERDVISKFRDASRVVASGIEGMEGNGKDGIGLVARVDFVEKQMDSIAGSYQFTEKFENKSEAFEYLKTDDFLIDDIRKTVSAKGWRAVDEVDVVGFIKLFVSAKAKMDQPAEDMKQHFRNWIFREPVDKLTEYAKTFKKSLPV
jgi:5-methylcytosine-specific restriction endonuclease McrA